MIETIKTVCSFLGIVYFPVIALSVWTQFRNLRLKRLLKEQIRFNLQMGRDYEAQIMDLTDDLVMERRKTWSFNEVAGGSSPEELKEMLYRDDPGYRTRVLGDWSQLTEKDKKTLEVRDR